MVITYIRGLVTPPITTHEPPSGGAGFSLEGSKKGDHKWPDTRSAAR